MGQERQSLPSEGKEKSQDFQLQAADIRPKSLRQERQGGESMSSD